MSYKMKLLVISIILSIRKYIFKMRRNEIYTQVKRLLYFKYQKQILKRFIVQRKNQVDQTFILFVVR